MNTAKEISKFIDKDLKGKDLDINYFSELSNIKENTIVFARKFSDSFVELLNQNNDILAIVTSEYKDKIQCSYIISENPRLVVSFTFSFQVYYIIITFYVIF